MSLLPSSIYLQRVSEGTLSRDPGQLYALEHLDRLHGNVLESASSGGPVSRLWSRLTASSREPIRGCYLWGGVGTGKSMLMDVFYDALGSRRADRTHFHRFMRTIHDRKNALGQVQDPLKIIAGEISDSWDVLCLDEFMVTDITDAMILAGLLKNLFASGCTLVTTSNTPISELYRDGLQRSRFLPAIELLIRNMEQVHVDQGQDYRMQYLQDDGIYHTPADDQAHGRMETTFKMLGSGADPAGGSVNVNDRDIDVIAKSQGVIWFEFDAICRTTRSSHDYIEIARQYHTVMLSAIPRMNDQDNDAARRFIELVDELYDRNVNLIVSSNSQAHQLYAGKRLEEPFQRTASRLVEMSSDSYLSRPHLG